MTITEQLAAALRDAEKALAWSYEVVDYPANGMTSSDKALAKARSALAAYDAQPAADDGAVERVARAISAEAGTAIWDEPRNWIATGRYLTELGRDQYRRQASAALAAMAAPAPATEAKG